MSRRCSVVTIFEVTIFAQSGRTGYSKIRNRIVQRLRTETATWAVLSVASTFTTTINIFTLWCLWCQFIYFFYYWIVQKVLFSVVDWVVDTTNLNDASIMAIESDPRRADVSTGVTYVGGWSRRVDEGVSLSCCTAGLGCVNTLLFELLYCAAAQSYPLGPICRQRFQFCYLLYSHYCRFSCSHEAGLCTFLLTTWVSFGVIQLAIEHALG